MARRIVWTSHANNIFTEILQFYVLHNKSQTYSRKLNRSIHSTIDLLKLYPFLGKKTDIQNIRFLIYSYYKIFYEVKHDEIVIHLIWDTRQNPKDFNLKI